jgi:hypothetical protein
MSFLLNAIFLFFYAIWQVFRFFGMLLKKALLDVLSGVYGKFVALLSGIIFLAALGSLTGLFIQHI